MPVDPVQHMTWSLSRVIPFIEHIPALLPPELVLFGSSI